MKCEKCGKEANFYYSSTVNGQHEEHCFCAECAKEAGFENAFSFEPSVMNPFGGMFDGFFESFFAPARMLPSFDSFAGPFGRMMAQAAPRMSFFIGAPQQQQRQAPPQSEAETKVPADAGEDVKARREREALKQQLQEAVEKEDYETAITLRDQLRRMEQTNE